MRLGAWSDMLLPWVDVFFVSQNKKQKQNVVQNSVNLIPLNYVSPSLRSPLFMCASAPAVPPHSIISWPPVQPVPTKTKSQLEYTLGLLRVFVELQPFAAAAALPHSADWMSFEAAVDADFLGAIRAQCAALAHRQAQKLLGLYRATKSKVWLGRIEKSRQ
jgi:hypothetical protein